MSIEAITENERTLAYLRKEIATYKDASKTDSDGDAWWRGYVASLAEAVEKIEKRNQELWKPIIADTSKMIEGGR